MPTTMPIGFDGWLMQSRENRSSQERRMMQRYLCYCKFSIWTSLTLTTTSRSDWLKIARQSLGGERFARRCGLTRIWIGRRDNSGES